VVRNGTPNIVARLSRHVEVLCEALAGRRLQGARLRAFPDDLDDSGIAARVLDY